MFIKNQVPSYLGDQYLNLEIINKFYLTFLSNYAKLSTDRIIPKNYYYPSFTL